MRRSSGNFALLVTALLGLATAASAADPGADPAFDALLGDSRFAPFLLKAVQARDAGKVDEALDHLRQANNAIKKAKGANHPDQLPVLDMAADILFAADRLQDAVTPLKRALAIREAIVARGVADGQEIAMASSLLLLGRAHASTGRYETGLESLTKAVRLLDASLGRGHEATARARQELAEAVSIFEKTLGLEHPATLKAQRELLAVEMSVGDYEAAARVLERMLAVERARAGDTAESVLVMTAELAAIEQRAGRVDDAVMLLSAAIERAESGGAPAAAVSQALRHMAEIQLADAADHEARETLEKALLLDEASGGEGSLPVVFDRLMLQIADAALGGGGAIATELPPLAETLAAHADKGLPDAARGFRLAAEAALAGGNPEAAAGFARRALDLDEPALGASHADAIADRLLLGRATLASGNADAALALLEAAHRDARTALGASHAATLDVAQAVAACQTKRGSGDEAEKIVVAMLSRDVGYAGRALEGQLVEIVDGAAEALEKQDSAKRATALRDGLVALRRRQFGDADARVAQALTAFGQLRLATRRWADAIGYYESALAVQDRALTPDHPDIAATLVAIGKCCRAAGRHAEAREALSRAASIWGKAVGPDHPVTLETVKLLALTELSLDRPDAALPLMERLLAAYDADPSTDPADVSRLLVKLAEVRADRGETETGRAHLARALAMQSSPEALVTAVDIADFAKRYRLQEDDAAPLTIAGARAMADGPSRSGNADAATAETIRHAWDLHASGDREGARALVKAQLHDLEATGAEAGLAVSDLIVALADMRETPLDVSSATQFYRKAAALRERLLGDSHPATIAALERLGGAELVGGEVAAAGDTLTHAADLTVAEGPLAALATARDAAAQTALIASAVGAGDLAASAACSLVRLAPDNDAESATRAIDILLASGRPPDGSGLVCDVLATATQAVAGSRFAEFRDFRAALRARAAIAEAAGRTSDAEQLLGDVVAADEKSLPIGAPTLAADMLRLACLIEAGSGRTAAASWRERSRHAIDAWIKSASRAKARRPRAEDTDGIVDLARALAADGDEDRAEQVLKAGIDPWRAAEDRASPALARLLVELGERKAAARPQQAVALFDEATTIFRDSLGGGHGLTMAAAIRRQAAEEVSRSR